MSGKNNILLYQLTFLVFHFRAPWYFVERKRAFPDLPLPNPNWLRKDFDTCVRRGDKECQYLEGEWTISNVYSFGIFLNEHSYIISHSFCSVLFTSLSQVY